MNNIKRAVENDAAIVEGHVTSVMLDDVFFLLKKCIQAWLPVSCSKLFGLYAFGPSGLKYSGSAMLCCNCAKFASHPGASQGKEGI